MKPAILDRPPAGWFVLDVAREKWPRWDWCALMVNFDPDEPCWPTAREQTWVRIPGKHRDRDAACDALDDMLATRH
jgi:hypothetical protein